MKFLIVVGVLALAAVSQGFIHRTIEFPENLNDDARIIEGWPAVQNQFPHQVNLLVYSSAGGAAGCGGSLISQRWVLTAAHCLIRRVRALVRLGALNVNAPELSINSTTLIVHPNYNEANLNNDIGLIDLGRDLPITASIKPIRLLRKGQQAETQDTSVVTASGYGYTSNNGPVSPTLNFVNLTVISNTRCAGVYGSAVIISSTICTVGLKSTNQGTCSGDSGGPLILAESDGWTQVGVVSFGSSAGCSGFPSGFVRPVYFLDWINQHTGLAIRP